MGKQRRAALTSKVTRWRDYLSKIEIRSVPKEETAFALRPLHYLAGSPESDFPVLLIFLRSWWRWSVIVLGLSLMMAFDSIKPEMGIAILTAVAGSVTLAVFSMITHYATDRALHRYNDKWFQPFILIVLLVGIVFTSLLVAHRIAPYIHLGFRLANYEFRNADIATSARNLEEIVRTGTPDNVALRRRALDEARARADQPIPTYVPEGKFPFMQALMFWPEYRRSGVSYAHVMPLLAGSLSAWVRLTTLIVFLFSWLVAPLTMKFAFANLNALLDLQKPILTASAMAISSVLKGLQWLINTWGFLVLGLIIQIVSIILVVMATTTPQSGFS